MSFSSGSAPLRGGDRHGWNSLDRYITIHDACIRRWEDVFVEDNDVQILPAGLDLLRIEGRLRCKDGIFIDVVELLEINDRNQVRAFRYSYHAALDRDPPRSILRYDNAHTYSREGHTDAHHKHRYNHLTWEEIDPPVWVGYDRRPTLNDVIDEVFTWWDEIGRFLG